MGLRWALSLSSVENCPNFESHFRRALQCLPDEDVIKQERFHYRNDSLACIVGRLMIRAAVNMICEYSWHEINISRTKRGKPFLSCNKLFFNISHQGDLVVLATSKKCPIGIDVMKIDEERGTSAIEHINRMKKLFSSEEVTMMTSFEKERERWTAFYRIWCLKEVVLKATGIGLVDNLNDHSFICSKEKSYSPGCFILDTKYYEKGIHEKNWRFEESFIGPEHCVAVGKVYPEKKKTLPSYSKPRQFQWVTLSDLLCNSSPFCAEDNISSFESYSAKPWKNF